MKKLLNKLSGLFLALSMVMGISAVQLPTVQAKVATQNVSIVSVTTPAARNSNATLTAHVKPGAIAYITVHYKSGPSKAKGLEPKKADSHGNVSWTWRVGGSTTLGYWPITISSNGQSTTTRFKVVR